MIDWKRDRQAFLKHISERRVELGLTKEGVSLNLGKSPGYMFQVEKGRGLPSLEVLIHLAEIYREDPKDYAAVRTGEGRQNHAVESLIDHLSKESQPSYNQIEFRPVPVISLTEARDWDDFTDREFPVAIASEYLLAHTNDPNAFYVRAEGDSMAPEIRDGDLVLIEPREQRENGDIVFTHYEGEAVIKKLHITDDGKIILVSLNSEYPPLAVKSKRGFKSFRAAGTFKRF